jgi:Questin oxidase-like
MTAVSYADAVNDALERLDDLGYERGDKVDLANHGPMGAEALAVLGHGEQVSAWTDRYRRAMPHHAPPEPRFALDPSDEASWRPALGAFDRAGDWEGLFRRELAEACWPDVLAQWWPRLLPGVPARLTHGLIRTAHAVRSLAGTDQPTTVQLTELARGLAYWAARYVTLPGEADFRGQDDLATIVGNLPRVALTGDIVPRGDLARQRVRDLGDHPGYLDALTAGRVQRAQHLLSEMTAHFAGVYLAHPDINPVPFIHAVTAPAAVRLVLPYLPEVLHLPSVTAIWQVHIALLAAFTGDRGSEDTALAQARRTVPPSWGELAARAADHGDEHVIKFTEACQREYALRPDPRFPAAVLAAHHRIPSR